jgi:hypothetical protein
MGFVMGHGHVTPNPGGRKARCGGPSVCQVCARERAFAEHVLSPVQHEPPPMPGIKPAKAQPPLSLNARSEKYDKVEKLMYEFVDAILEIDPERHATIGIGRNIEGMGHLDLRLTWVCDQ